MAGVDLISDLLMKNRDFIFSGQKFDSSQLADFLAVAINLASTALSGVKVRSKQYNIKVEPIYSALKWDALGLTTLTSLRCFLPLIKSRSPMKDLVLAVWEAGKYILFKVIQVTIRLVIDRLAVRWLSPRIASKLVKGYAIGALASWSFQVGQHIFGFFVSEKSDPFDTWKKIFRTTATSIVSLIFSSICAAAVALIFGAIGAWVGGFTLPFVLAWIAAKIFCPATGLFIGFVAGDFAGDALISFCLEKLNLA